MRTRRTIGLLLALWGGAGCGAPPAACEALCDHSTQLYGACLDEWGLDWVDAGYADAAAYTNSCDTWVFEEQRLDRDAGEGDLEATCVVMDAALTDCNSWFEVWSSGEG